MDAARLLQGEPLPDEAPSTGERSGVLYRLRITDAAGNPVEGGAYHIRKHHVAAPGGAGAFAPGDAFARIVAVSLDGEGSAYDFVGLHVANAADGEDETFQYFSFELQGVTHAITQSGYALHRIRRGAMLEVTRTPRAGEPIHGAVAKGLVKAKADATFGCKAVATSGRTRPRVTR